MRCEGGANGRCTRVCEEGGRCAAIGVARRRALRKPKGSGGALAQPFAEGEQPRHLVLLLRLGVHPGHDVVRSSGVVVT